MEAYNTNGNSAAHDHCFPYNLCKAQAGFCRISAELQKAADLNNHCVAHKNREQQPFMEFYYFTTVEEGDLVQISHHLLADSTVPTSNVSLAYMAEGAANVIWSVGGEATIKNKLLRIRKGTWSGDGDGPPEGAQCPPPFLSSSAVFAIHQSKILPLFEPGQLVEQELVHVDAGLVTQCNAQLDELERANLRPTERRHWHIKHEETYGLLITSMLPTSQKSALFHFKPKWLAQSPTAPPNARRCRTCALAARRGTDAERLICPLALYGGNEDMVRAQIEARVRGEATMSDDMIGRRPSITTERFMQANEMLKANVVEALIQVWSRA